VIEIRTLDEHLVDSLCLLLDELKSTGADSYFHPHPMTREAVENIVSTVIEDQYFVVLKENQALGYGMLRGWDEGYDVPSLGIAVCEEARGTGLAEALMYFLHCVARIKGATRIRLTVYDENERARRLFERLGYEFGSRQDHSAGSTRLVGFKEL
jgi:ribosomal protein S18 acetylase RimI-like enzyme